MIKKLSAVWLLLLGLAGAVGLGQWQRQGVVYPYLVYRVADESRYVELTFLGYAVPAENFCANALATITNAIGSTCSACRILERACLQKPTPEQRALLSEAPLDLYSARLPNGVITYRAPNPELTAESCAQSERQSVPNGPQGRVICTPPNQARTLPSSLERGRAAAQRAFDVLGLAVAALGAGLVILVGFGGPAYRFASSRKANCADWTNKLTLAGIDAFVLFGAFVAFATPNSEIVGRWTSAERDTVISYAIVLVLTLGWFWVPLEHYARRRPFWNELREIVQVLFVMSMVSGSALFIAGFSVPLHSHVELWAFNFLLIPLGRSAARQLLDLVGVWERQAVIIGCGDNARDAFRAIEDEKTLGYRVVGFVAPAFANSPKQEAPTICGVEVRAARNAQGLEDALAEFGNPQVVFALDSLQHRDEQALVQVLGIKHQHIHVVPAIRGLPLFGTEAAHFFSHEVLFLTVRNNLNRRSMRWFKRGCDIVGAAVAIIALMPLCAWVAWMIKREDGGRIFFVQKRVGKGGKEFGVVKFRSMVKDADDILAKWEREDPELWQRYRGNNFKLSDDPRVTRVGRWIRRTSVDEVPQLWNVLTGDMSLVGPRPLLARELPEYGDDHYLLYRQATPGITGLWQISGRSQTTFSDRAALDAWYVQNWSLWYDIAILFKTIDVVLARRGAY